MKRFIGWLLSFFVAAPAWPSSLTYAEWQGARIKAEQRRALAEIQDEMEDCDS